MMRGTLHVSRQMFCPKTKSMTQTYTFVKWSPFSIKSIPFNKYGNVFENLFAMTTLIFIYIPTFFFTLTTDEKGGQ